MAGHSSQSSQVAVMVVVALALVAAGYYVGSTGLAAAPSSLLDSFVHSNKAAADALTGMLVGVWGEGGVGGIMGGERLNEEGESGRWLRVKITSFFLCFFSRTLQIPTLSLPVAAQEEEEAAVAAAEEEILSEEEALDAPDPRAAVNESDPAVLRVIEERRQRREAARQKYKEELLAMVNEVKQAAAAPGGLKEEETVADVSNVPLQYGATEITQLGEGVGKGGGGEKAGNADAKGVTGGQRAAGGDSSGGASADVQGTADHCFAHTAPALSKASLTASNPPFLLHHPLPHQHMLPQYPP
ncbi:unnamed protein product [Closterium sp. NIES-64]|nr:unnamed protein product [Closterium sp. NIES-64]